MCVHVCTCSVCGVCVGGGAYTSTTGPDVQTG